MAEFNGLSDNTKRLAALKQKLGKSVVDWKPFAPIFVANCGRMTLFTWLAELWF